MGKHSPDNFVRTKHGVMIDEIIDFSNCINKNIFLCHEYTNFHKSFLKNFFRSKKEKRVFVAKVQMNQIFFLILRPN